MLEVINIMKTYFIKKLYFPGENNLLVELVTVTEETIENINNVQVVSPDNLASSIREIKSENLNPAELQESKIYITREQAQQLSNLVDDQYAFLNFAKSLF
ncbi:hypothetical protein FAY30_26295 (plasmid) [Bacillus sp. S3]|uniref:hypothetical protein n=1 Tax=Bacillus sp. S3 TaxID=486398 RepID=UPI001187E4AE|nr:hypothetical protein [Bacillus sp. S3]QCJ45455.1 hypothetical protein FAY30_26295 [Bacillus sp. S3]